LKHSVYTHGQVMWTETWSVNNSLLYRWPAGDLLGDVLVTCWLPARWRARWRAGDLLVTCWLPARWHARWLAGYLLVTC